MNYYDTISEGYNELYGDEQISKLRLLKEAVEREGIRYRDVIDIGCGTCLSRSLFKDVIGIDRSFQMIDKSRGIGIVGCAENLPLKRSSFDLVISISSVHHFNLKKSIDEMLRVGKDYFGITILKKSANFKDIYDNFKKRFLTVEEIDDDKDIILLLRCKPE